VSDVSLLFNFLKGRDTATPAMAKAGDDALKMAAKTKLAGGLMTNSMFLIGTAVVTAGSEVVAFTDAVAPMTGLLAAVPAVAFAAGASIVALAVGFHGLGAALKSTASGAGPSADAIANAEYRVAQAQRNARAAQLAVNDAREEAADGLRDLSLALARAGLDERAAVLAVSDAQKALRTARGSGDRSAVQHAQLSLDEAKQSLAEIQARTTDLREEDAKRTAQGVEGSDAVQQALQRQADTAHELVMAQQALAKAQAGSGGSNAAAEAYAKLAPSARSVVDALKSLAPAWREVQQATQQATFVGVGADIRALGGTYLPILKVQLAAIASGWNLAFRQTGALLQTPAAVRDVNFMLSKTAEYAHEAGQSMAPLVHGLLQFGAAGANFLPRMGMWLRDIAQGFDRWATKSRETGKINAWIENGVTVAKEFGSVLRSWTGAVANIFKAGNGGPQFLSTLVQSAAVFRDWTASMQGQSQLHEFFTSLREAASGLWTILKGLLDAFTQAGPGISAFAGYLTVAGAVVTVLANNMDTIRPLLPVLIAGFVAWNVAMAAHKAILLAVGGAYKIAVAWQVLFGTAQKIGLIQTVAINAAIGLWIAKQWALAAAQKAATIGQWLLNIAMDANPVGLIILAIVALVAVFVLLWTHSEGFRNFFIGMWDHIWSFLKMIGAWFAGPFVDFFVGAWNWIMNSAAKATLWVHDKLWSIVDFVMSLPGKIAVAARGMWDGIVTSFKGAINWLISLWNRIDFGINIKVPDWVPGIGGKGFTIPDILPDMPYLDVGGKILETGVAVVHKGETVVPKGQAMATAAPDIHLHVYGDLKGAIRKITRSDGGGNVQVAFGN